MSEHYTFVGVFAKGDRVKLIQTVRSETITLFKRNRKYWNIPPETQGTIIEVHLAIEQTVVSSISINTYDLLLNDETQLKGVPEYLLNEV